MTQSPQTLETLQADSQDLLASLQRFQSVLAGLQESHQRLEIHAKRMEAELEVSNARLADKVQELDRTNQYLEAILASLPSAVIVRDAQDRIVRINPACSSIFESDVDAWVETPSRLPLNTEVNASGWNAYDAPNGQRKMLAHTQSAVTDAQGVALGSVEIVSDQSELAHATEQMNQQAKMAALGSMAGGIAHEIRNPMNAVRGFAGLLARPGVTPAKQRHYAASIESGVQEVEGIITSLLHLANPDGLHLESLTTKDVLDAALDLIQREEGACEVEFDICDGAFALQADRIQMRQALRNLIANAVQAQGASGALRIQTISQSNAIVFEVHDSGPGIPDPNPKRLIDPFFTTRAEGMGLGLALVDSIARMHGGELELSSSPSQLGGALVRLIIPTS